jgi:hypothetical protein
VFPPRCGHRQKGCACESRVRFGLHGVRSSSVVQDENRLFTIFCCSLRAAHPAVGFAAGKNGQASRLISTGRLNMLPCLHLRPIDPVVFREPSDPPKRKGRPDLRVGLALRCFQRLSCRDVATRQCHWRDNRNTRGRSFPVLSYWGMDPSSLLRPRWIRTELSHDVLNPARVPL